MHIQWYINLYRETVANNAIGFIIQALCIFCNVILVTLTKIVEEKHLISNLEKCSYHVNILDLSLT